MKNDKEARPFAQLRRECVLTLEEVMPHLLPEPYGVKYSEKKVRTRIKKVRMVFKGHEVCVNSLRLACFKVRGVVCSKCGIAGEFFAIEGRHNPKPEERNHLNLYAMKDGEEVLMTQDHVIPKSKGGLDTIENSTTLCVYCNQEKGAIYPGSE